MIKKLAIIFLLMSSAFMFVNIAYAVDCDCGGGKTATAATITDCPTVCANQYGNSNKTTNNNSPVSLPNPLGTSNPTPQILIGKIINALLGLVGSIALAMFIWGGFSWMTAAGNTEKVQKGKDIIIWATLGMVVIFFSYALVNFVIKNVIGAP